VNGSAPYQDEQPCGGTRFDSSRRCTSDVDRVEPAFAGPADDFDPVEDLDVLARVDLDDEVAALIASSEAAGIWTVQTGIFPENSATVALHQRVGFRIVGTRQRIGQLNGI